MHFIKQLAIASLACTISTIAVADIVVSYYEPLHSAQLTETRKDSQRFSPRLTPPPGIHISFDALGRSFELQLESNDRLAAALPPGEVRAAVGVYRGRLVAEPQSWVRLVVVDGVPRGMFFDGAELFAIEAPHDSSLPIDGPVIYRLSDAHVVPGSMRCGADSLGGSAAGFMKQAGAAASAAMARGPGAVSEITMSVIGDHEFTNLRGGDVAAAAAIVTRFNNIDGYFSEQVGVQIAVQLIETHSNPADPFGDTLVADDLLDELSEYRLQSPLHNLHGLTHLYTGRNLDTNTVGIAWQGVLCENYFGAGLTQGRGGPTNDSLIAAHEIGHNFNAQHDGEAGASCESVSGDFIMSSSINGSQQFSDCSVRVMQTEASRAACVVALPTVDVSVEYSSLLSSVLLGSSNDFSFEIANNGTLDASDVTASISVPDTLAVDAVTSSAGTCTSGGGFIACELGTLAGLRSEIITVTASAVAPGTGTLAASVATSAADERAANNQDSQSLTVKSAVDLVATAPAVSSIFVNENTGASVTLRNLSTVAATDVTVSIALGSGLRAGGASWSPGNCTVEAQLVECRANTLPAQSTSTIDFSFRGVTIGNWEITVAASASEAEANVADNEASRTVRVVEQDRRNDSGGGSAGPLMLLVGLSVLAVRCRRIARRQWIMLLGDAGLEFK